MASALIKADQELRFRENKISVELHLQRLMSRSGLVQILDQSLGKFLAYIPSITIVFFSFNE